MAWNAVAENLVPDSVWLFSEALPTNANVVKVEPVDAPWEGLLHVAITDGQNLLPLADLRADYEPQLCLLPQLTFTTRKLAIRLADRNQTQPWKINLYSGELAMPLYNPVSVTVTPSLSGSVTASSVASATTSTAILAANSNRKGATIWNDSTATLYLDLDASVSASDYASKLDPGGYYELPFGYTGVVSGLWSAVNGSALVREFV